jgi:hypothetical protein
MASGIRTTREHVEVAYSEGSPGVRATRQVVEVAYSVTSNGGPPPAVTEDQTLLILIS